jgi:hypothetical protein
VKRFVRSITETAHLLYVSMRYAQEENRERCLRQDRRNHRG